MSHAEAAGYRSEWIACVLGPAGRGQQRAMKRRLLLGGRTPQMLPRQEAGRAQHPPHQPAHDHRPQNHTPSSVINLSYVALHQDVT